MRNFNTRPNVANFILQEQYEKFRKRETQALEDLKAVHEELEIVRLAIQDIKDMCPFVCDKKEK